jgi:HEAT repeat protein
MFHGVGAEGCRTKIESRTATALEWRKGMNDGEVDRGLWLIELASKTEDPTLSPAEQQANREVLYSHLCKNDVQHLLRFLGRDQDRQKRVLAAFMLARTLSVEAIQPLGNILDDRHDDTMVRAMVAGNLSYIRDARVVPYLGRALAERENDSDVRRAAAVALQSLNRREAIPFLCPALLDPDVRIQYIAASALSELDDPEVTHCFRRALERVQHPEVKKTAAMALGKARDVAAIPLLGKDLVKDANQDVRQTAAVALGQIGDAGALPPLSEVLEDHKDPRTRLAAAEALGNIHHIDAVQVLCRAVVSDQDRGVRESAANSIHCNKGLDWKEKTNKIVKQVEDRGKQRGEVDADAIVRAMSPPQETLAADRYFLTDYLIEQVRGRDRRMTGVLAKLIIQSAEESPLLAGDRVNEYQKTHQIPEDQLRELRIEIGGETALDPIMETLKTNLDKYFQEPIHDLNEHTRAMWQRTMTYAQIGFIARITMSILVFLVGMVLVAVSSWQVLSGNLQLDLEQLLGPGVSFVSGLGTMLLIVYTGPLKEIRRSVNDLGIGSAAFIAYVHRVLEISHTFSFYYLKEKITFEEMGKSSELIKGAMHDTIMMLHEDEDKPPPRAASEKRPAEAVAEQEPVAEATPEPKSATKVQTKTKSATEAAGVAAKEKAPPAHATGDERPASQQPAKEEDA